MKLLTVIHWADLPQLLLQAISINKFWKSTKTWTIIIEDNHETGQLKSIEACNKIKQFMPDWNIEVIIPDSTFMDRGWVRQQLFKLWYSAQSQDEWVLVLDCKMFLIRPVAEHMLVHNNKIKCVPVFDLNEFTITVHEAAKLKLNMPDIPPGSSATPCVINAQEAKSLVDYLGITLDKWVDSSATEFSLYWCWTYKKFKYRPKQFVTGFWDEVDLDLATQIQFGARYDKKFLFWAHHRYVKQEELRSITEKVLHQAGIPKKSIELWREQYTEFYLEYPSFINQDRSNWK